MKAPKAPDPVATANAQANANVKAATTQQEVNQTDQITPYGNLNYSQVGSWADGTPHFQATQTLSDIQQQLLDQSQQADLKTNQIGLNQIDKVGGILAKPVDLSTSATEGRAMDLARGRLDPVWQQNSQNLEQDLLNRGIRPGSEAYASQHDQFARDKNDAYNNLLLSGHQQAVSDILQERNQPLNEINSLINGQQIQNPTYAQTPQASVAAPDIASMIYKNYDAKNQNYAGAMGGLFGLGSAAIGGASYIAGKKM